MADPRTDVEQLHAALARMGERAAADPAYRETLRADQVEELRAIGVSAFTLSGVFAEEGAEEQEVAAFGMSLGGGAGSGGQLIASSTCLGTCSSATITVCCSQSIGAAAAAHGTSGAAGGAAGLRG